MDNQPENPSSPGTPGEKSEPSTTSPVQAMSYFLKEVQAAPQFTLQTYIKYVQNLGKEIHDKHGIMWLVPCVQSAHESRYGNSGLARNHGNLFGITATEKWKKNGNIIASMPTWEVINGKKINTTREFRGYVSWRDSFYDWARIITELNIYKHAFTLLKDQATVLEGITEMGRVYATDPAYAKKLLEMYNVARGLSL